MKVAVVEVVVEGVTTWAVDWSAYLKCRGCGAVVGEACRSRSGSIREGRPDGVAIDLDTPHRARKLRKAR